MKRNQLFKLLIDISFYLLVPVIVLFPGAILYTLVFPDQEIIKLTTGSIPANGWKTTLILIGIYAEYLLFFIGFYHLRKFAVLLLKNRIFTKESVKRTKRIGQFFTACGASSIVLSIIFSFFSSDQIRIEFGFSNVQLFLFLVIIGLFFLILSRAFQCALQLE